MATENKQVRINLMPHYSNPLAFIINISVQETKTDSLGKVIGVDKLLQSLDNNGNGYEGMNNVFGVLSNWATDFFNAAPTPHWEMVYGVMTLNVTHVTA